MTNVEIQKKAVETLVLMNTTVKNLRLYPATSAMIVQTVDKLYEAFLEIFAEEEALVFAESERSLLIGSEALPKKDQERLAVAAFLDLMLNFGLRSVGFERGMTKEELTAFVDLMSKKPEAIKSRGGIQALASGGKLEHIILNQKVYIASDHSHQIAASLDIKDDQIIQYLASTYPEQDIDLDQVRAMARDANWIKQIFQSGMAQILKQRGAVDNALLSDQMVRMLAVLDKVADHVDRNTISRSIGKTIADLDPEIIRLVLIQKIQDVFGGNLYQDIISQIDEGKYEALTRQMRSEENGASEERSRQQEKQATPSAEQVREILNAGEDGFFESATQAVLPDMVRQLAGSRAPEQAGLLVDRVVDGLTSTSPEYRAQAAGSLVEILDALPAKQQTDLVSSLSKKLTEWIRREEAASPSYQKICRRLKEGVADDIRQERYEEALPVLEVFSRIRSGLIEKNDAVRAVASEIISELAAADLLKILFEEFNTDAKKKQLEAGRVLARLGEAPLNRLLDLLREKSDSNERVRILQLIGDIGATAVPVIRARIKESEPWYYLRNLAYLLGRVGNEATVKALEPLLLHHHARVRQEALKSIHRIGGHERGALLLSVLPRIDDSFKVSVVELLGVLRHAEAVEPLIQVLTDRPVRGSRSRTDLEVSVCTSLGHIGVPAAIPTLLKIARSGGFFSVRPYDAKVITAAEKAVAAIRKRQAEAGR